MAHDTARRACIDELFDEALDLSTVERPDWLEARVSDPAVRFEVEALLAAHESSGGILDRSAVAPALALVGDPSLGRHVGPYRLLRELGRGGMGVVYLAERDDGQYRRRVALKLLRSEPHADDLRRRFVAERQILASLNHPNIAQLLDGGVTDGQLPYLVMEHVDGLPITEYCDRHRLTVRERVRLFQDVCAAVHHAHQNLVIHRDLKPSNILVTDDGQVKLLDFGIAKLLNPMLGGAAQPLTRTDFRVLTPEYASPEQVRGESLTTSSDVYALGVVLYELLCGRRPFAAGELTQAGMAPNAREQEAVRPSSRVERAERASASGGFVIDPGEVAHVRGASPDRLRRQLRGDLDAIVLYALRAEPRHRYGSAELLSQDLRRHLDALPVAAHRGSRWYLLRKLCERHRGKVLAATLVGLSLGGGTGVALQQARAARLERDRAQEERRNAEDAARFLVGLFEGVPAAGVRGDTVSASELLQRGVARIPRLAARPDAQARLLTASALVYKNLARYTDATALLERAATLRADDAASAERAAILYQLVEVRRLQGRHVEADRLAREALDLRRESLGPKHPDVTESLVQLARLAVYRANLPVAEAYAREALALRREIYGPDHKDVAWARWILASILNRRGKLEEAQQATREALATFERVEGPEGEGVSSMLMRLSEMALFQRHDVAEAEALRRRAIAVLAARLGENDLTVVSARGDLAYTLVERGEADEAVRLMRESLVAVRKMYGPAHPDVANRLSDFARILHRAGRYAEGEAVQREALEMWERFLGRRHNAFLGSMTAVAHFVALQGRLAEADSLLRLALVIRRDSMNIVNAPLLAINIAQLASLRAHQGRRPEADSLYREALAMYLRHTSARHHDVRALHAGLARLHESWGRRDEAARWRAQAGDERPIFDLPAR